MPTTGIAAAELRKEIASYAVNEGNPFLIAYYKSTGTSIQSVPLHVIRYDRSSNSLARATTRTADAAFTDLSPLARGDCLGSALRISERYGRIYLDTHIGPSAGCVLVFSRQLSLEAALSGALVAVLDSDCAVLEENEIHFASVSPLHLKVIDFKRHSTSRIYPPPSDHFRDQYSERLRTHMPSHRWCAQTNSQCDPLNFDCELDWPVAVDATSKSFAFIAQFDSGGFGPAAARYVSPERVSYIYRLEDGHWKHTEAPTADLRQTWNVTTLDELVSLPSSALFDRVH